MLHQAILDFIKDRTKNPFGGFENPFGSTTVLKGKTNWQRDKEERERNIPKPGEPGFIGPLRPTEDPESLRGLVTQEKEDLKGNLPGYVSTMPTQPIENLIKKSAQQNNVPPGVLSAILWQESRFDPKAVNVNDDGSKDRGIGQIHNKSFPNISDAQAFNPSFAIPWAARKLASDFQNFGEWGRAIAAYNVGRGGASVQGPEVYGGGPKGQSYLNNVANNMSPNLIDQLGLRLSVEALENYLRRKGGR